MDPIEVTRAAFTFPVSFSDIFPHLMTILGIGAVLLFVLVLCSIYGLCKKEKSPKPH